MSAFGWRFIVLSYLAVLVPLLGIALPRDAETHWGIVAAVLVVALATLTLNAGWEFESALCAPPSLLAAVGDPCRSAIVRNPGEPS